MKNETKMQLMDFIGFLETSDKLKYGSSVPATCVSISKMYLLACKNRNQTEIRAGFCNVFNHF